MFLVTGVYFACFFLGYLFFEFDKFWRAEQPRDIMEFNRIKTKFQKKIVHKLKDKRTVLQCNFATPGGSIES